MDNLPSLSTSAKFHILAKLCCGNSESRKKLADSLAEITPSPSVSIFLNAVTHVLICSFVTVHETADEPLEAAGVPDEEVVAEAGGVGLTDK